MLISSAYAQAQAAAQPGGGFEQIFFVILICAGMYFFFVRPQNKRDKEHRMMVEGLAKGDEVYMRCGMAGRIAKVSDDLITVTIAENVDVLFKKEAVAIVLPKGTLEKPGTAGTPKNT